MAVGLGHALLALSSGAVVEKMQTGQHGSNYPVVFKNENKAYLTTQNHLYAVLEQNLPKGMQVLAKNVNDDSVEAVSYDGKKILSLQFHLAEKVGPQSTDFFVDQFLELTKEAK